jgi:hypothetical protein
MRAKRSILGARKALAPGPPTQAQLLASAGAPGLPLRLRTRYGVGVLQLLPSGCSKSTRGVKLVSSGLAFTATM